MLKGSKFFLQKNRNWNWKEEMEIGRDLHGANEHTWDLRYIFSCVFGFQFFGCWGFVFWFG